MRKQTITFGKQASLCFASIRPLHSTAFRKLFSEWLFRQPQAFSEIPDLPLIFQRDAAGLRINANALVRFETTPLHCAIHALTEPAARILEKLYPLCQARLSPQHFGSPSLQETPIAIVTNTVTAYRASQLGICKNAEQFSRWKQSSHEEKLLHIASTIERGIQRQITALGGEAKSLNIQSSAIELIHEWPTPKLQNTIANAYMRVVDTRFELPVRLQGSWSAGFLNNKGFGLFNNA